MDPTGFAVGVIGLAGLVSTCIEGFRILRSMHAYSRDTEILFTKLDIEKELFMQWAQQVGLLKKHTIDGRLFDRRTDALIYRILREIKCLLAEAGGMEGKYGETVPQNETRIGSHYQGKGRRQDEYQDEEVKKISWGRKFLWTVHGRDELKSLIDELGYFVGKLDQMIPSLEQRKATCKELKEAGTNAATFSTLMLADARTERDYESSDGGWEDLASVVASEAVERRPRRRRRENRDEEEDRRDDQRRGRKERDLDSRRRRNHSPSSMSQRSHRSSNSSGSSHKSHNSGSSHRSSRSILVEMFDDVVGSGPRPTSTWRR